jgi:hypothetical protein
MTKRLVFVILDNACPTLVKQGFPKMAKMRIRGWNSEFSIQSLLSLDGDGNSG